jgi:hypothetical protein
MTKNSNISTVVFSNSNMLNNKKVSANVVRNNIINNLKKAEKLLSKESFKKLQNDLILNIKSNNTISVTIKNDKYKLNIYGGGKYPDLDNDLGNVPSTVSGDVQDDVPSTVSDDVQDDVPSTVSDNVQDDVPSAVSGNVQDDVPSTVSDDVQDDVPSTVSDDVPSTVPSTDSSTDPSTVSSTDPSAESITNPSAESITNPSATSNDDTLSYDSDGELDKSITSNEGTVQEGTIQEGTAQEGTAQEGTVQEGTDPINGSNTKNNNGGLFGFLGKIFESKGGNKTHKIENDSEDEQTFMVDSDDDDEESLIDNAKLKNKKFLNKLNLTELRNIAKNNSIRVSKNGQYLNKKNIVQSIHKNLK